MCVLVARQISPMNSLVTSSRMQQCFNVFSNMYNVIGLLYRCCILLEKKTCYHKYYYYKYCCCYYYYYHYHYYYYYYYYCCRRIDYATVGSNGNRKFSIITRYAYLITYQSHAMLIALLDQNDGWSVIASIMENVRRGHSISNVKCPISPLVVVWCLF